MFGWKTERKDGLTVKLLSNGDLIIRLHYLRELLYGLEMNVCPISAKGMGSCFYGSNQKGFLGRNEMKRLVILLAVVSLLFGCARPVWVHPEYTPEKWKKDSYECERDARQSHYFGTGITGSINMQNFFNRCLESKGWMRQQEAVRTRPAESIPPSPVTSTPITPSSGTTKIFTWDFSVVKSGPGNNYPVIATVRKGDKLIIMGQSGEWVNVRLENGQEGWINNRVLE